MGKYPFLSDEWVAEARRLRDEAGAPSQAPPAAVRVNQVVTDVPFGGGTIKAHIDTSSGEFRIDVGHLDDADATVTLEYGTAKALFVDGSAEAGMQAFLAGKVVIQGDLAKVLAAIQQASADADPQAFELHRKIRDITE